MILLKMEIDRNILLLKKHQILSEGWGTPQSSKVLLHAVPGSLMCRVKYFDRIEE